MKQEWKAGKLIHEKELVLHACQLADSVAHLMDDYVAN